MKFRKPDTKVMQAFAALRANPHFLAILEYLENCKRTSDDEHRTIAEEYRVRWNQGGTRVVDEILRLYEESKRL